MQPDQHPLLPLLQGASRSRVLLALGVVVVLGAGLWVIRDVATPVFAALGTAYIFSPIVAALERRGVPRPVAVSALMIGVLVLAVGVIAVVVPALFAQIGVLGARLPGWTAEAVTWLDHTFHLAIPTDTSQMLARGRDAIANLGPDALGRAGQWALDVLAGGAGALTRLLSMLLVPVFMFFFLKDWATVTDGAMKLLPAPMQAPIGAKLAQIDQSLSAYVRGVLTVAAILAVLYSLALSLLGVPLGLLVGVLAGLAYVVPFMSTIVGVSLGVLFSVLEFHGWGQVLGVLLVFVAGNAVESLFLTPRIVGDSLGLPPIAVILAVMIGGNLFGFLGVMLALPAAAVINVIGRDLLVLWRASELYKTGLGTTPPPAGGV